ncbi:MAG TPA: sn-glycerol-3-phosphate ABC transporter ATP-binding protein UgpC [bacterium]|mgnify:FL=1|nr:sn-glycerol-3-phosphate ABC transporter ATP-binding protein UgpC [bacterium]HQL63554.1 sn-glycerol-3-phosphate ABC transporter ATP-binding protein UgpC [bacterium]
MARVVYNNVTKLFPGDVVAVKDFSLEVEDKEFVVLVGPSGCGKSTSLRMVAGLEEVTSGEIYIGDRLVNDVPPKDRDIAMVFQNYALYPHMTVYKNMAFGLKLRKYPKDEIERRVREAAEILGITELMNRKPKALSGGQRQRVAVGRAIVRKPKVFLFDEPLSNLDAKLRVQMRAEISKLHNRLQATMIYVTHDQMEAMTMGDRIVVMKDGEIQQVATPLELYDHPKNRFVAGFIGTPPMNFIEGKIERANGRFYFNEGTFRIALAEHMSPVLAGKNGAPITFGIRPEDIKDLEEVPNPNPEHCVTSRVEVVEPVGAESFWYLTTGLCSYIAKVGAHLRAEVNADRRVVFFVENAHLFDPTTQEALI